MSTTLRLTVYQLSNVLRSRWFLCYAAFFLVVTDALLRFGGGSERPLLGMLLANPVDLARVSFLLRLDVSALMGYTGAVFGDFFGHAAGASIASGMLVLWIVVPAALGLRAFRRKGF